MSFDHANPLLVAIGDRDLAYRSLTAALVHPHVANACFDPDTTKVMGEVFDEMIRSLDRVGRPRVVQEAVARQIIEAVQRGERDRDAIYQRVLAAMALNLRLGTDARRCA